MDNASDGKTDAALGASNTEQRLETLSQERDSLRTEVESLRKSLEQIQTTHHQEIERVQAELDEANGEKEQAETQYQTLLGKVNTIKSQLGERLKTDRVRSWSGFVARFMLMRDHFRPNWLKRESKWTNSKIRIEA